MRLSAIAFMLLLLAILSGCNSYYPLPVDEKNISQRLATHNTENGLPVATTQAAAFANLNSYSDWYFLKASEIHTELYTISDRSLGFGIAGLIAGVAKSPEGAAAGALLSSASQMPADRYQLAVQAANYEKASDAMNCMYRHLVPLRSNSAQMPDVFFLNDSIYQIRRKLREAQASITLVSPDLAALEANLKKVIDQDSVVEGATEELADATKAGLVNKSTAAAARQTAAVTAANAAIREQAENHLNTCITKFSG